MRRSNFVNRRMYEYVSQWWMDSDIVYWRPNRAGYTNKIEEAGFYTAKDLELCAGNGWDWFARPVTADERRFYE